MKKILLLILIAGVFTGCLKDKPDCNYNECNIVAPASEIQSVQSYLAINGIAATQHCSGLFYTVNLPGSGDRPGFCDDVLVNYEGRLTSGTVFDKTNGQPIDFNLAEVVTGFRNGIPQLKKGGKITLYVPPSLGYGNSQAGSIPPNSILIFDVELVDVP